MAHNKELNINGKEENRNAISWCCDNPVSYTHLDVYKRQGGARLMESLLPVPAWRRPAPPARKTARPMKLLVR